MTWCPATWVRLAAAAALMAAPAGARAQEAFAGIYVHAVDTPLSLEVRESGSDLAVGYRFARVEALRAIGSPAPYVLVSLNSTGDTSFAGAGISWTIGRGRFYLRPALGLVVHDGPGHRVVQGQRLDLGSRVLFEPEIALGYRLSPKVSLEASWMHVSHARLFDREQNPGIDMMGARLNWRL